MRPSINLTNACAVGPKLLPSLSVVIPCHDEAACILRLAQRVRAVAAGVASVSEVIVVDDGSRDDTARLARLAGANVRVLSHSKNRGYGAALSTGLFAASSEWVAYIDGDGQFDPNDLRSLAAAAGPATIVSGVRGARRDAAYRTQLGDTWTHLCRHVLGLASHDVNCGIKLFPRGFLDLVPRVSCGGFVDAELLYLASRAGFELKEIEVTHHPRIDGVASGARPSVALRAAMDLLRFRLQPTRIAFPAPRELVRPVRTVQRVA